MTILLLEPNQNQKLLSQKGSTHMIIVIITVDEKNCLKATQFLADSFLWKVGVLEKLESPSIVRNFDVIDHWWCFAFKMN